ncbi:MAG: tyrosine-type recombinase/integrase [Candidatus Binataceae bacterium]
MASIKRHHQDGCNGQNCGCQWRLDYRPMGTYGSRRRVFFPTKKAAEKHLAETSAKASRGEYLDRVRIPTFNDAAESWFRSKSDRRASHIADLRGRLDKHLLPRFGADRLDRITVGAVEKLRDDMRADGYAPRTINRIIRIVGAVFRAAIRRGDAIRNPVDCVERAFMAARELRQGENEGASNDDTISPDAILSPDEIRTMLNAATPGLYRTLFTTAALTGARSGELFALRWGDIEIPKNGPAYIYIRRTVSWARINGEVIRPRYYPPKTKAGVRRIPIQGELATMLRVWKLQCPATADELVFPAADGRPIRRSNALRYGLWAALRHAGLRRVNMHSLRHSFASALIMGGAAVTEVQSLLGHASPAITLRIYSHWFQTVDSGAVARLSQIIFGSDVGTPAETGKKWALSGHSNGHGERQNRLSA